MVRARIYMDKVRGAAEQEARQEVLSGYEITLWAKERLKILMMANSTTRKVMYKMI
jgi:hypothetical protein